MASGGSLLTGYVTLCREVVKQRKALSHHSRVIFRLAFGCRRRGIPNPNLSPLLTRIGTSAAHKRPGVASSTSKIQSRAPVQSVKNTLSSTPLQEEPENAEQRDTCDSDPGLEVTKAFHANTIDVIPVERDEQFRATPS